MFTVQENSDPNFVKYECRYISLSIWTNMVDVVVGLNVFLYASVFQTFKNEYAFVYVHIFIIHKHALICKPKKNV